MSFIWSKGPFRNNYSELTTESICLNPNIIKNIIKSYQGNVLWIRNGINGNKELISDLEIVSKNLELITKPTILITTDGDRSVPSGYKSEIIDAILSCKNITVWYTQNYDMTIVNCKLKHFPIGFDLHSKITSIGNNYNNKLKFMLDTRLNSHKVIDYKILSDTHFNITNPDRLNLFNTLKNNKLISFTDKRLEFRDITKLYNNYLFVLSPQGNGLDCHRTWELFLAGCIVITKHSPLDKMYTDNNLPVVLIDSWNELNDNLLPKLQLWKTKYIKYTDYKHIIKRLDFNYWLNQN